MNCMSLGKAIPKLMKVLSEGLVVTAAPSCYASKQYTRLKHHDVESRNDEAVD